jgi:hypothetical protein
MMNIQPANKISEETLLLFRKVLEDDLKSYAIKISNEQNIDINALLELIPIILSEPIIDKINLGYRDTSKMRYKKELNLYSLTDLKEIAKTNELKISGNRADLLERISEKLGLVEYSNEELDKAKSFKSMPLKQKKKPSPEKNRDSTLSHYISDSD